MLLVENDRFYKEKEILESVNLCDRDGKVLSESIGWSRSPLFNCNLSGRLFRKKKWNYWCITNNECLFSVTISHIDYAAMIFTYFLDFKSLQFIEKTIMLPLGKGVKLPNSVHESVIFNHPKINISFLEEDKNTHIICNCNDFGGFSMEADFLVTYPDEHETLNVVIPWSDKVFQFTSKHEALPVQGFLKVGINKYSFNPISTFACLDFGRGIWPYKVMWNWATASGIVNEKRIGINLGAKWTDGSGLTENGFVIDGKLTKLSEDIIFEYDRNNLMKPWVLKSALTDRVNLTLIPFYERVAKSNLLIVKSEVHQLIGHFSGTIKADGEETIFIDNIVGAIEEHWGQW
jgi:hypothetical protein